MKNAWVSRAYIALAGLIIAAVILFLAISVARDLQELETARSDNAQWALSQAEVEYLEFSKRLTSVAVGTSNDLASMRRRFDIFYSRITLLETAPIYQPLKQDQGYARNLVALRAFLDAAVPLIDGDDATLMAALPELKTTVDSIRTDVRRLSNSALDFFVATADQRRREFAQTLLHLAGSVILLVAVLGLAVYHLRKFNVAMTARQRDAAEAAARMETVIQTSLDGVIVADEDGTVLAFNAASEAIFGHDARDVLGKQLGPLIVPDHMFHAHEAGMRRVRSGGRRQVVGKGRIKLEAKHSSGRLFPVELAIQSAQTKEGNVFIAFLRDISERLEAEKELINARDQALTADRIKTEFLATMSHEIRTPLNGLLGNLTLIQDTNMNLQQLRYIRNMETSGQLLLQHVTDVLDLSRYDVATLELRRVPVNLAVIIQSIVDSQSGLAANNNTTIEWDWLGKPVNWVVSDPDALQHIIMNLVGNAVKFTKNGCVAITLEATKQDEQSAEIVFQVSDTGQGMDDDLKARIFDDFVTGSTAYDRPVGGTGLGLGIVRRSVKAMGGKVDVESTPDAGSKFDVYLAFERAQPITENTPQPIIDDPIAPLRVLLVEDNEINRAIAREMLEADGHVVTEVHDGAAAVALAQNTPFDLILMDINMPVMDGRTATRKIRSGNGVCAQTRILALTANALASEQAAFVADGMNGVMIKPLSRKALRRRIRAIATDTRGDLAASKITSHQSEMRDVLGDVAYLKLKAQFIAEVEDLHEFLNATAPPAMSEIVVRCHKVAGSSAVFGAMDYRAALIAIEDAAKLNDADKVRSGIVKLATVWGEAAQTA